MPADARRPLVRNRVKHALARVWPPPRGSAGALAPIVCYHSVSPVASDLGVLPERFEAQIAYLTTHFRVLPLDRLVEHLKAGTVRPGSAVVTFDDGYVDNHEWALPILRRYGCPATVFVVTAFIQGKIVLVPDPKLGPLTWGQLRDLRRMGWTIGAHSHTHQILRGLPATELKLEIAEPKTVLEEELGEPVTLFAYPNGQRPDFDERTVEFLRTCGYVAACSTLWGTRHRAADVYALRRIVVHGDDDLATFSLKVHGRYDYLGMLHRLRPRWRRPGAPGTGH